MYLVTVLKSGGDFDARYIKALANALYTNGQWTKDIICLTDMVEDLKGISRVIPIPLKHNWPGWWSKIELFRPGLFSTPVLYMDLDSFIFKDLSKLMNLCNNHNRPLFLRGAPPISIENNWLASCMMSWQDDQLAQVYNQFVDRPSYYIKKHQRMSINAGQKGDQGYIRLALSENEYDFFQDLLPQFYIMFKRQIIRDKTPINNCHVLNWSGSPRPHIETHPFNALWKEGADCYV